MDLRDEARQLALYIRAQLVHGDNQLWHYQEAFDVYAAAYYRFVGGAFPGTLIVYRVAGGKGLYSQLQPAVGAMVRFEIEVQSPGVAIIRIKQAGEQLLEARYKNNLRFEVGIRKARRQVVPTTRLLATLIAMIEGRGVTRRAH